MFSENYVTLDPMACEVVFQSIFCVGTAAVWSVIIIKRRDHISGQWRGQWCLVMDISGHRKSRSFFFLLITSCRKETEQCEWSHCVPVIKTHRLICILTWGRGGGFRSPLPRAGFLCAIAKWLEIANWNFLTFKGDLLPTFCETFGTRSGQVRSLLSVSDSSGPVFRRYFLNGQKDQNEIWKKGVSVCDLSFHNILV